MKKLLFLPLALSIASSAGAQTPGSPKDLRAGTPAGREQTSRTEELFIRNDDGSVVSTVRSFTVSAPLTACVSNATTLCLGGRFRIQVTWHAVNLGTTGVGTAVPVTSDTGYFWFFGASNIELVIKVLDGRAFDNAFWVFYGALSDVEYTITVTDLVTGATKTYTNQQGTLASVADTFAFPSAANCAYAISTQSQSVGASGATGSVGVLVPAGCPWIASSNDSWITIGSGTSGNGNGTVAFSVAANPGAGPRTGTLTVAGQTFTVTQAGTSAGLYAGSWSGSTSQGKGINFTIAGDAFTLLGFGFAGAGSCSVEGTTTVSFTTPRAFSGGAFSITVSGGPPSSLSWTVTGTFTSPTTASGSVSFTFVQSSPLPPCSASGSGTWTATKS